MGEDAGGMQWDGMRMGWRTIKTRYAGFSLVLFFLFSLLFSFLLPSPLFFCFPLLFFSFLFSPLLSSSFVSFRFFYFPLFLPFSFPFFSFSFSFSFPFLFLSFLFFRSPTLPPLSRRLHWTGPDCNWGRVSAYASANCTCECGDVDLLLLLLLLPLLPARVRVRPSVVLRLLQWHLYLHSLLSPGTAQESPRTQPPLLHAERDDTGDCLLHRSVGGMFCVLRFEGGGGLVLGGGRSRGVALPVLAVQTPSPAPFCSVVTAGPAAVIVGARPVVHPSRQTMHADGGLAACSRCSRIPACMPLSPRLSVSASPLEEKRERTPRCVECGVWSVGCCC